MLIENFMFGGFIGFDGNKGEDWGEKLLNTVASNTIRHLFSKSESVEVLVRCHPSSKLLQGSIDSFQMKGRGLVIRKDFRTEKMSFATDTVSLDFSAVLQGKIALKQPCVATTEVQLSEIDLNQAFQAELVRKRLENLCLPGLLSISGQETVSFTDVNLQLLPHNKIQLFAKANLANEIVPVSMSCTLAVAKRRRVLFQDIKFEPDLVPQDLLSLSENLTKILGEILNGMIDLDRFNLDGVTIRINRLETQGKMLIFNGYAEVERVPHSG